MNADAPETPYARQRALIEELIEVCGAAAKTHGADVQKASLVEEREVASRGLDRTFRAVRVGTNSLMRIDQGAVETRERNHQAATRDHVRQRRAAMQRLIVEQDWGDRDPLDVLDDLAALPDSQLEGDILATLEQLCRILDIEVPTPTAEPEPASKPLRPENVPSEDRVQRARDQARRRAMAWTDSS